MLMVLLLYYYLVTRTWFPVGVQKYLPSVNLQILFVSQIELSLEYSGSLSLQDIELLRKHMKETVFVTVLPSQHMECSLRIISIL